MIFEYILSPKMGSLLNHRRWAKFMQSDKAHLSKKKHLTLIERVNLMITKRDCETICHQQSMISMRIQTSTPKNVL